MKIPLIPLMLLAAATVSGAQETGESTGLELRKAPPLTGTAQLIGIPVKNEKLETYGQVEELVLHPDGQVAFVVASYSGWMDMEGRQFVMPWSVLDFDREAGVLTTALTADQMRKVPRFRSEEWPDLEDFEWWKSVDADRRFRRVMKEEGGVVQASTSLAPTKMLFRVGNLKGQQIYSMADEKIGEIRELAVDTITGRVSFAVLSVGGYLGSGEKDVAVPWGAIRIVPDPSDPGIVRLALDVSRERLAAAPAFVAADVTEQTKDPAWVLSVYEFYGVSPYWALRADGVTKDDVDVDIDVHDHEHDHDDDDE